MNILMVNNLKSGTGSDPTLHDFLRELGANGAEVVLRFLDDNMDLQRALRDADAFDRVIAAGGDGTVSAVSYALRYSGVPIVTYPAGTANLLARNLRMPIDPIELAELTVRGPVAAIDLGEMEVQASGDRAKTNVGFAMAAGAGFDAALMEAANGLKSTLGEGAYMIGLLQNLAPTVSRFRIELDGGVIETEGIAVLMMNLARIQFDLEVAHGTDAQDGLLEVVIVTAKNAAGLLPTVWAALLDRVQRHPQRPGIQVHSASRVRVHADPALPLEADGEVFSYTTPFSARVLPLAARFVVPEDSALALSPMV